MRHSVSQARTSSSKLRQARPEGKTNGVRKGWAPTAMGPPLRASPSRTTPSK